MNLGKDLDVAKLYLNTCCKTKRPRQNSWLLIDRRRNCWPFCENITDLPKSYNKSTTMWFLTDFSPAGPLNAARGRKGHEFIWANFNMSEERKKKLVKSTRTKLPKNEKTKILIYLLLIKSLILLVFMYFKICLWQKWKFWLILYVTDVR